MLPPVTYEENFIGRLPAGIHGGSGNGVYYRNIHGLFPSLSFFSCQSGSDCFQYNPDLIVLSYEIMQSRDSWNFGKIPVAYFGKNEDELEKGSLYQIPSIESAVIQSPLWKIRKKSLIVYHRNILKRNR